ncbi:DUF1993 domain-containing protein [Lysobacter sp. 5GHs7-4]|uniref:DUF1993 domain-containing protein n=1 Tax=Lysobacter sp. 5GHs7-4 TaxID=2904253 RepID=UPI001E580E32|nr:DUF1993 domain-containing protein [Lysobacter sp. 5GHs7-4]UHQ25050.1 DUF1993 domain-containing protein [Lysobacter sp. 5GHs7-4]
MTVSMHAASVPVFKQFLGSLSALLDKAQAFAADKKIEPEVLLQSRLYPDMFPLQRQVQIACDFAKSVSARLADAEVPSYPDDETSVEQLQARIAKATAFIDSLEPLLFEGSEARDVVLRPGTPKERRFSGTDYLLHYGLPQFYFHVSTAYAILRHNGVEVGKRDYMGQG